MYFRATDFLSLFLIGILIIQTKVQGSNADRPRAPAITPRPTTTTSSPTPSPCCSSSAIARTLAIYAGDRTGRAALRAATAADSLIYAMQECTRAYKLAHTAAMIIEQDVHNSNPHITTGSDMELTSEKCDEVTSAHNALLEKWREARRLVEEAEKQFEIAGGAADRGLHLIAHKARNRAERLARQCHLARDQGEEMKERAQAAAQILKGIAEKIRPVRVNLS